MERNIRRPTLEVCELRLCLTTIHFTAQIAGSQQDVNHVETADLDLDGDLDIVFATDSMIGWYENTNGKGSFADRRLIATTSRLQEIHIGDIDLDNDLDVLSASADGISWYENGEQLGEFEKEHVVRVGFTYRASLGDVDIDGDLDVLGSYHTVGPYTGRSVWYENIERFGTGTFGPEQNIPSGGSDRDQLIVADFDNDGDNDVLANLIHPVVNCGNILWSSNLDGEGIEFGSPQHLGDTPFEECSRTDPHVVDFDSDGDLDVVGSIQSDVWWYENRDGLGDFPKQIAIFDIDVRGTQLGEITEMLLVDIDNDTDDDLLIGSYYETNDSKRQWSRIDWVENGGGPATFGPIHTIVEAQGVIQLANVADVDGDEDVDVIATSSGGLIWFQSDLKNHSSLSGDANGDGEVSFIDFLVLANHFDQEDANIDQGDFDGDSRVTFQDFVILASNFGASLT